MTTPYVRFQVDGAVATITLARAEKLNAIDIPMIEAPVKAAGAIEESREIRWATIMGEVAGRLGIVDEVVPQRSALSRAHEIWTRIAEREETVAVVEGIASALVSYTSDLKEGAASFRDKRRASYTNT